IVNDQNPLDHGGVPGTGNTNMVIPSGTTFSVANTTFGAAFSGTLNFGTSGGALRFIGTGAATVSTPGKFDLGTGSATLFTRDGNGNSISLGALAGGPNTTLAGAASSSNPVTYKIGQASADAVFSGRITDGTNSGSTDTTTIEKLGTANWTL